MITDEIKKYRVLDEIRRNQFGTIFSFGLFCRKNDTTFRSITYHMTSFFSAKVDTASVQTRLGK
jgi:hypothetical protein